MDTSEDDAEAGDALITVMFDGAIVFSTDGASNTMAPADYNGRQAVAMALAAAAAALAELPPPLSFQ